MRKTILGMIIVSYTTLFALAPGGINAGNPINTLEPVSCFDYYKFGSVHVSLETKNFTHVSGTKITIFGEVKNDNNFPVVNGKILVKVMRENDSYLKNGQEYEIDSFVVKDGISLASNSSVPVEFIWDIPAYAISGNYHISSYFIVDNRFNINGSPYTEGTVGGGVNFSVIGEQKGGVFFDTNKTIFNKNPYSKIVSGTPIQADEKPVIELTLMNDTSKIQRIPVSLELYKFDPEDKQNLLMADEKIYLIHPKSSIKIPYQVTDTNHSQYYLFAKAKYEDENTEVGVHFLRAGKEDPRIVFSTLTTYPVVKGQENNLIACVRSGSEKDMDYGKVVTTLYDHDGNPVQTNQYEGKITRGMQGFRSKLVPSASFKDLSIETKIYGQDGNVLDQTKVDYKCSDFSHDCKEPVNNKTTALVVAIMVLLMAIIFIVIKYFKKKDVIMTLTIILIFGVLMLPKGAEAKEQTVYIGTGRAYNDLFKMLFGPTPNLLIDKYGRGNGRAVTMGGGSAIKYNGNVKNLTTGQVLNENSSVNVGDRLRFIFGQSDTDFSGDHRDIQSNYTYGSLAYGDWVQNANMTLTCSDNNFIYPLQEIDIASLAEWNGGFYDLIHHWSLNGTATNYDTYAQLSVNPPTKTLTSTDNLSCGNLDASGHYIDCLVTGSAGSIIQPKFNYGETYAKEYFTFSPVSQVIYPVYSLNPTATPITPKICFAPGMVVVGNTLTSQDFVSRTMGGQYVDDPRYYPQTPIFWATYTAQPLTFSIPAQEIPFSLSIQNSCAVLPTDPVITVSPSATVDTDQLVTITLSSQSANAITFQVDWGSGLITNETNIVTKIWTEAGNKTIKVRALDTCGESAWVAKTIVVNPPGVLDNPVLVSSNVTCNAVTLSWVPVAGAERYELFRNGISRGEVTSPYSDATGLNPMTTYTYTLLAQKNTGANLIFSESAPIVVITPTCSMPNLIASAPTPNTATVNSVQTFTSTITNNGTASTGTGFNNFFQIASAAAGGGTIVDKIATTMSELISGGTSTTIVSHTFATTGTHSIRACADKNSALNAGTITESNEGDNCSAWTDIIVNSTSIPNTFVVTDSDNSLCTTRSSSVYSIGCDATNNTSAAICKEKFESLFAATSALSVVTQMKWMLGGVAQTDLDVTCTRLHPSDALYENITCTVTLPSGGNVAIYQGDGFGGGNTYQTISHLTAVDTTTPTGTIVNPTGLSSSKAFISPNWSKDDITVKVQCANGGDPTDTCTCEGIKDVLHTTNLDGSWSSGSLTDTNIFAKIFGEGKYNNKIYYVTDNAGNPVSPVDPAQVSVSLGVDRKNPEVQNITTVDLSGGDIQLSGVATDALSGIIHTSIAYVSLTTSKDSIDCGSQIGSIASSPVSSRNLLSNREKKEANKKFIYCVRDAAGNEIRGEYPRSVIPYYGCFADGTMTTVPTLTTYTSPLITRMTSNQYGYSLSDSTRAAQNATFLTRLSQNLNTFIRNQYDADSFSIPGTKTELDLTTNTTAARLQGSNTKNTNGYYYYMSHLSNNVVVVEATEITGPKVIFAEGVDVQINGNITYKSGTNASLVIIARKLGSLGGNIFIAPGVGKISATLVADGALLNHTTTGTLDWLSRADDLQQKLTINGRLFTRNTRGGSLLVDGTSLESIGINDGKCFVGSVLDPNCSFTTAAAQDLERFRVTKTMPTSLEQCTLYVSGTNPRVIDILSSLTF